MKAIFHERTRFILIQFLSYLSFGLCMTNLIPYMDSLGYSSYERSYALTGYAIFNILVQFLFGYLSDKTKSLKWIVLLATGFYGLTTYLIFTGFLTTYFALVIGVSISGGLLNCLCGLEDTWVMGMGPAIKNALSPIKAFGSLGWAVGSLSSAWLISHFQYEGVGVLICGASIVLVWFMFLTPDIHKEPQRVEAPEKVAVAKLLKNKSYLLLLATLFLMYSMIVANAGLVVDKMLALQASNLDISLKWTMGSLLEIPMYFFGMIFIRRFKEIKMLQFSALVLVGQFLLFGLATNGLQIVWISALQIFTTPIIMVTSKRIIADITPTYLQNSGQLVALSIYMGGASLLTPVLSGILGVSIGYSGALFLFASFGLVALFLAGLLEKSLYASQESLQEVQ